MKKMITISLLALIVGANARLKAQDPESLLINPLNRYGLNLNGKWHYIVDPYETGYYDYRYQPYDTYPDQTKAGGAFYRDLQQTDKSELLEYNFDKTPGILVPGDWNTQDRSLFYYEGSIWYRKKFDLPAGQKNKRLFLYFGAANYRADVYLNGTKVGTHTGGFTPFNFEVTGLVKPSDNSLVVKVDNKRVKEGVPTLNTDWWNYGGLTRDVRLIEVPGTFIRDYKLDLKKGEGDIVEGYVKLDGKNSAGQDVTVNIPGLKVAKTFTTGQDGTAAFRFSVNKLVRWSPENPRLYNISLTMQSDTMNDRMGFRTIEVSGTDILLNGKPVFLRGISIHEENPVRGARAYSEDDARMLLGWAKELGCNFARLAHYPHNEHMARVAEEMGIMLWEEIPVYWTIQWNNKETFQNAENQLNELITRDKNRASVIVWSVGNETPVSPERTTFMSGLIKEARRLDDTRLVSAAMEVNYEDFDKNILKITDPLGAFTDLLSFNEYLGWYTGLPDKCRDVTFQFAYDKPVFISELGGGALQGFHGDSLTRWTEEFQKYLYEEQIPMLRKIQPLRGMTPWILADFRSPKRPLPFIQDGWNRKGLIGQRGDKKEAFYVLRDFYLWKKKEMEK